MQGQYIVSLEYVTHIKREPGKLFFVIFSNVFADGKLHSPRNGNVLVEAENGGSEQYLIASAFGDNEAMMLYFAGVLRSEFREQTPVPRRVLLLEGPQSVGYSKCCLRRPFVSDIIFAVTGMLNSRKQRLGSTEVTGGHTGPQSAGFAVIAEEVMGLLGRRQ